jgi:hypothetical protein
MDSGLPYFSWYNIPTRESYTKWQHNMPKWHKIYQMEVTISRYSKNTQIGIFGMKIYHLATRYIWVWFRILRVSNETLLLKQVENRFFLETPYVPFVVIVVFGKLCTKHATHYLRNKKWLHRYDYIGDRKNR